MGRRTLANLMVIAVSTLCTGYTAASLSVETINPEKQPQQIIPWTQSITLDDLKQEAARHLASTDKLSLNAGFAIRSQHPLEQVELHGAAGALVITNQLTPALLNQCFTHRLEGDIQLAACPASFGAQSLSPEPELFGASQPEVLPEQPDYQATVVPLPTEQLFSSGASTVSINVRNSAGQTTSSSLSIRSGKYMTMPPVMERLAVIKDQSLRAEKPWLEGENVTEPFGPKKKLPGDSHGELPVAVTLRSPDLLTYVYKKKYVHTSYTMMIQPGKFKHTTGNHILKNAAHRDLSWDWVIHARGTKMGDWCWKHKAPGYSGFRILDYWSFDANSARTSDPSQWQDMGSYPSNEVTEIPLNIWHMGTECSSKDGDFDWVTGTIVIRMKSLGTRSQLPKQIKHPGKYKLQINVTLTETL